ncbi:MAG: TadE family protein [Pirellulales bacterium]
MQFDCKNIAAPPNSKVAPKRGQRTWGGALRPRRARRRGQALIELAVVAFVVTLLLSIILAVGMLLYADQGLQQAVDVGAQELARLPLPPVLDFPTHPAQAGVTSDSQRTSTNPNEPEKLFAQKAVREQIFDESYLVVDISPGSTELPAATTLGEQLELYFARAPLLNRLLRPLMIVEEVSLDGGPPRRLLRYPGALVRNTQTPPDTDNEDLTVLIPLVRSRTGIGPAGVPPSAEVLEIEWRSVVEEIRAPTEDPNEFYGPFSLVIPQGAEDDLPDSFQAGFVALRLNYPFQAGSLVGFQYRHRDGTIDGQAELGEDVENLPIGADDAGATVGATPPAPYQLVVAANSGVGPNAGRLGMGRQYAFGGVVRPFRRVLSTQAIYRREVFE